MEHPQTQRVKRTQRDYSFAFKMKVIYEVEKGQITYKQAQEKYGIQVITDPYSAWQRGPNKNG